MSLFTALVPPAQIIASLDTHLEKLRSEGPGARWTPNANLHVTLGYYGDEDDAGARVDWLRHALKGRQAPMLRLEGAGTFSRVLYLGVYSDSLTDLATAVGAGEERPFLPHLTVAHTDEDVPEELPRRLSGYVSEWWTATEVVLLRSERSAAGVRFRAIEHFPLDARHGG